MEIQASNQSAFYAGVQGFQNATDTANKAATDIVAQTTVTQSEPTQASTNQSNASLTDSIVALNVAETQAQASAKVIKTADEMLGTIIDTKV